MKPLTFQIFSTYAIFGVSHYTLTLLFHFFLSFLLIKDLKEYIYYIIYNILLFRKGPVSPCLVYYLCMCIYMRVHVDGEFYGINQTKHGFQQVQNLPPLMMMLLFIGTHSVTTTLNVHSRSRSFVGAID